MVNNYTEYNKITNENMDKVICNYYIVLINKLIFNKIKFILNLKYVYQRFNINVYIH